MTTVVKTLSLQSTRILAFLKTLLLEHSSIFEWNNMNGPIVVISANNYAYKDLDTEGRQIQTRLSQDYDKYFQILKILLAKQPANTIGELIKTNELVRNTIEQNNTYFTTTIEAYNECKKAIEKQIGLLSHLYDPSNGMPSLIPDTNALIYFPDISKWTFPEMNQFTIALMPTVLEELDSLKINHNNSTVREKAEKIIRMIKGYRNRGSLTEGVNIVKNKIKLVAIPIEPNGIDTLPWIDLRNNDDRFLCSTVDFIRSHICSPVIVVSRDINLQNKCEYALIPYKEPPEPISTSMGA